MYYNITKQVRAAERKEKAEVKKSETVLRVCKLNSDSNNTIKKIWLKYLGLRFIAKSYL